MFEIFMIISSVPSTNYSFESSVYLICSISLYNISIHYTGTLRFLALCCFYTIFNSQVEKNEHYDKQIISEKEKKTFKYPKTIAKGLLFHFTTEIK